MSLRQLHGVIFSLCRVILRSTLALCPLVITTTTLPNEVPAAQLIAHDLSSPPTRRGAASASRATTLVHRRQSSHISTQALAAIILCSTVVFCAFIGCLLQLPAALSHWRRRVRSCTPAGTQSTANTAELPDAEMGDQPIPMAGYLSPPPPYSRAPSYEAPGPGSSSGRRSACAP